MAGLRSLPGLRAGTGRGERPDALRRADSRVGRRRNFRRLAERTWSVSPPLALLLADRIAPWLHPFTAVPDDPHVLGGRLITELLGPLKPRELEAIARRSASARYRGVLMRRAIERQGLPAAAGLLRWRPGSLDRLNEVRASARGALFTTWHAGPTLAIWSGLYAHGFSLLKLQIGERFPPPPDWEFIHPGRDGGFEAPAMKRALRRLRSGDCVAIPADMYHWSPRIIEAPCLGRRVAFSRAIPTLASMSGAPVIPIFASWSRNKQAVELDVQPPLSADAATDLALTRALAQRVEIYLRGHLEEYDAHYARLFAAHPRIVPE